MVATGNFGGNFASPFFIVLENLQSFSRSCAMHPIQDVVCKSLAPLVHLIATL